MGKVVCWGGGWGGWVGVFVVMCFCGVRLGGFVLCCWMDGWLVDSAGRIKR